MKKKWMLLWIMIVTLGEARITDAQIANMFVLGFEGAHLTPTSRIVQDVCERGLGGVILFGKNIRSRSQLKALTHRLRCPNGDTPLIATDQEGGRVARVRLGTSYPRAYDMGHRSISEARTTYDQMGTELHDLGINYNLAPVADLYYKYNGVIGRNGRSFGSDPQRVIAFDTAFIQAMNRHGVVTALKHYPGHGSSRGDTHKGFVDVTHQWKPAELEPFKNKHADSVMVAHVVCDPITGKGVPASLSPQAIRTLHRVNPAKNLTVITDDLQMGAIRKRYTLENTIKWAILAGDDLLLFGNQLIGKHTVTTCQLIGIVRKLMTQDPRIASRIQAANRRIQHLRHTAHLGIRHPRGGKCSDATSAHTPTVPPPSASTPPVTPGETIDGHAPRSPMDILNGRKP